MSVVVRIGGATPSLTLRVSEEPAGPDVAQPPASGAGPAGVVSVGRGSPSLSVRVNSGGVAASTTMPARGGEKLVNLLDVVVNPGSPHDGDALVYSSTDNKYHVEPIPDSEADVDGGIF